jgi:hypothetical protein
MLARRHPHSQVSFLPLLFEAAEHEGSPGGHVG